MTPRLPEWVCGDVDGRLVCILASGHKRPHLHKLCTQPPGVNVLDPADTPPGRAL